MKIDKNNKGEIKIPFLSKDDLNRILDILSVEL
jgi:ParB family chromosome partitioning protein